MGTPTRRRRAVATLVAALLCALGAVQPASAAIPLWPWEVVSQGSGDAPPALGYSTSGRISADGRRVAFESDDDGLHEAHDDRSIRDVYLKDMDTGELQLVSRIGLAGPGGDDTSHVGGMSADARLIGFGSHAKNLHPLDTDPWYDSFVKDMVTGEIRLLSPTVAEGRTDKFGGASPAQLSADGRYAVFGAIDFGGGPSGIYRRDLETDELELVSQPTGSEWSRAEVAGAAAVSDDGRYVAFSTSQSLAPEDSDEAPDVYLRDAEADTTVLVSGAHGGYSERPTISADGGRVAYVGQPDGRVSHALVWDRATGETEVADRVLLTDVAGNGHAEWARISPDGKRVVFMSFATNLGLDLDDYSDVFVRDLETGLTQNLSYLLPGPGRWHSGSGDITPDNEWVVFGSGDDYLSLDASDEASSNVYRRRLIQFPPLCLPGVQAVPRDSTASLALSCVDLERDDIEYEILEGPQHGTLGPVDQDRGTVDYTPEPGYTGPDSVSFRASDASGPGTPAVVQLVVHPPVPVEAPGGPPAELPGDPPPVVSEDPPPGGDTAAPGAGAPQGEQPQQQPRAPQPRCSISLIGTAESELLRGGDAGDLLRGGAGDDRLRSEGGDDCLEGGPGADSIMGGVGDDSLFGGAGSDSLIGGTGDDRLDGGAGRDVYSAGSGADRISAVDGKTERIDCGSGRDRATVDRGDRVRGCEVVRRRAPSRR